jgi:hypothetical protein
MDSTGVIKEIRSGSKTANVIDTRQKPGYLKWRPTTRLACMSIYPPMATTPGATQPATYNAGLSEIASAECLLGWK